MAEYMTRPLWTQVREPNKRKCVWLYREQSAFDLAARVTGKNAVTEEAYNAAHKLLDSVQRYALADARAWELDNDEACSGKSWLVERQKRLDARRENLQKRLAPYGVHLENYGLYPTIVENDTKNSLYYLHYFE